MDDSEEIKLSLVNASRDWLADVTIILSDKEADCVLTVFWPEGVEESFIESDFYECLRCFRRTLDAQGIKVLCEGARPNVFPSPMARAGGALKAYSLTLGEQALSKDLVNIFDPVANAEDVGTVTEQDDFQKRHFEIFREKS